MAGVLLAIVVLLTSIGYPSYGDTPPAVGTRDLRVTDVYGNATIEPAENPKAPQPIDEDVPLQENDVIVTGPKSRAELTMDGETIFKVQPDSRFKVLKIFPSNTQFEIAQGGVVSKVKPVEREEDAIIIKLPTAVVAIRGTEFAADTGNGVTHVGVFDEGHVAVAGAWGHEHVLLEPNQETEVPLTSVPKRPQPISSHFKTPRAQMPQIRSRVNYWHQHWEPIGPDQRKQMRQRISSGVHFPSQTGFRHSAMPPPVKAKPKRAPIKHHVAAHKTTHKPVHHTASHVKHKAVHHTTAHHTATHATHKTVHHAAAHHTTPVRHKTQTQN